MNKQPIIMERLKNLHEYRQELVTEEKMLKKLLSQLQEQVHVLQIEQFHLAGLLKNTDDKSSEPEDEDSLLTEKLDLNVPVTHTNNDSEEEEEQD